MKDNDKIRATVGKLWSANQALEVQIKQGDDQGEVKEAWRFSVGGRRGKGKGKQPSPALTYKHMMVFLRSVTSLLRLLPAHRLSNLSCGITDIQEPSQPTATKTWTFAPIHTAVGILAVAVCYESEKPKGLAISDVTALIIPNYNSTEPRQIVFSSPIWPTSRASLSLIPPLNLLSSSASSSSASSASSASARSCSSFSTTPPSLNAFFDWRRKSIPLKAGTAPMIMPLPSVHPLPSFEIYDLDASFQTESNDLDSTLGDFLTGLETLPLLQSIPGTSVPVPCLFQTLRKYEETATSYASIYGIV